MRSNGGRSGYAVNRPVVGPTLTREEALEHWPAAAIGALVVALCVLLVVKETRRARRRNPPLPAQSAAEAPSPTTLPRIPRSIRFERVPNAAVVAAAAISLATVPLSFTLDASFSLGWLAFLAPWIPIAAVEARYKHARDTLFASFGLLVILQLLHMVEHSVQVGQLVATNGALAESHGIFGQLDFELVHFVTDTTLWISLGQGRNVWLVVAFAAASFHQVEHFYLFWLNHADNQSPLDRPYLHYTYNFIVFVPMLIAIWDEARRVDREQLGASRAE